MQNPENKFSKEIKTAIVAALKAGRAILAVYHGKFKTEIKNDNSPVTQADLAADKVIHEILSKTNLPILSEETRDDLIRLQTERIWIVDPLDGTKDFINKSTNFSVMIALVENKTPIAGVVYQPIGDNLYVAEKNSGAFLKNVGKWKQLKASKEPHLKKARAVASEHHFSEKNVKFFSKFEIDYYQIASLGLKAAEIATGKADFYINTSDKAHEWDTAAAFVLIKEAGGQITDLDGKELIYNNKETNHKNGCVISNGLLHKQIIEAFREFRK